MPGFFQGVATNLLSAAITFWLLDRLIRMREEQERRERSLQDERRHLAKQLASPINSVAQQAAEDLRSRGWLTDGTLDGVDLVGANLANVVLIDATLRHADLRKANLNGADLRGANLQGADLRDANFSGADFRGANLLNVIALGIEAATWDETTVMPEEIKPGRTRSQTPTS